MIKDIKFIVIDKNGIDDKWKIPTVTINGKREVMALDIGNNKIMFVYELENCYERSGVFEINQSVIERALKPWHQFNKDERELLSILFSRKEDSFGRMDRFFEITMRKRKDAEQYGSENIYLFSKYLNTAFLIDRGSMSKIRSDSFGDACLVDKNEKERLLDYRWSFSLKGKRVHITINRIKDMHHNMHISTYLNMLKKGEEYVRGKELHHVYDCMDNRLESTVLLTPEDHKKERSGRHAYHYKIETFKELICFLIFVNSREYKRLYM